MHSVFYAQQFWQSAFAQHHQSQSMPAFGDSHAVTEVYFRRDLERAASGDLKKAPNLGDNKRGYAGLKLGEPTFEISFRPSYDFGLARFFLRDYRMRFVVRRL
jgi:hypothetical protein